VLTTTSNPPSCSWPHLLLCHTIPIAQLSHPPAPTALLNHRACPFPNSCHAWHGTTVNHPISNLHLCWMPLLPTALAFVGTQPYPSSSVTPSGPISLQTTLAWICSGPSFTTAGIVQHYKISPNGTIHERPLGPHVWSQPIPIYQKVFCSPGTHGIPLPPGAGSNQLTILIDYPLTCHAS